MGRAISCKRCTAVVAFTAAATILPAHAGQLAPPLYGPELTLGAHLLVGGVVLVTALCFGWLVWLMLTCPPEDHEREAPRATLPESETRGLLARIGARLGHPGPL